MKRILLSLLIVFTLFSTIVSQSLEETIRRDPNLDLITVISGDDNSKGTLVVYHSVLELIVLYRTNKDGWHIMTDYYVKNTAAAYVLLDTRYWTHKQGIFYNVNGKLEAMILNDVTSGKLKVSVSPLRKKDNL